MGLPAALRTHEGRLAHAEKEVERWRDNLRSLESDRRSLRWIPPIGAALSIPAFFWASWAGWCALALTIVTAGTGYYLVNTRVAEFTDYLARAEEALARVRESAS